MKTIILYATRHGAAKEIAEKIASQWEGATLCDLQQNANPSLDEFDCVIIGGPLYARNLLKPVKDYARSQEPALLEKRLGLFLSGLGAEGADRFFNTNFPHSLLKKATVKAFIGGIYDPARCNWAEKLIMKAITRIQRLPVPANTIREDRITAFIAELKAETASGEA